eukprot:gene1779-2115_t
MVVMVQEDLGGIMAEKDKVAPSGEAVCFPGFRITEAALASNQLMSSMGPGERLMLGLFVATMMNMIIGMSKGIRAPGEQGDIRTGDDDLQQQTGDYIEQLEEHVDAGEEAMNE